MPAPTGATTLYEFVARHARERGAVPAVLAPGHVPLSWAGLHAGLERAGDDLARLGLGRSARIATVLADDRDAALATLALLTWATAIPLDPRIDPDTCAERLAQLRADALLVSDTTPAAVADAARAAGCAVVHLARAGDGGATLFDLSGATSRPATRREAGRAPDVALVALTSGTTARPRAVPTTHAALASGSGSALYGPGDRLLCITPGHTTSGIGFGLQAPVKSGAGVVLCPGFDLARFFDWLDEFRPTAYSASPTVHAAIVDALAREPRALPASLRLVRSSSSGMTAALQERIEAALGVPVVQAYGSSEAGLIAEDSAEPGRRRAGTVGRAVRLMELRIADDAGAPLPAGAEGEIQVRGPSVMAGYEDDDEANRQAFVAGWYRTGDLGSFDADGYLTIRGRVRERVNRGGIKISPLEVDAVLSRHPAVLDAACAGVPHPSLGEDLVAAVVRRPGASATVEEIRAHAVANLAPSQVPSAVVFVDALPRNAMGKLQRAELSERLRERAVPAPVAPRDEDEALVARLFAEVLALASVGAHDNFFELGGDSLRAMRVLSRLAAATGLEIAPTVLFEAPTVAAFAGRLRAAREGASGTAAPRLARQARRHRPGGPSR